MKKATLKDVAEYAGVSTATVSYVVNNSRGVSDEVREKVNQAIKALAYSPNKTARNFKTGRFNTIGFIVPDIANIYFSAIIEEVESILSSKGMNLVIANTKETPERELEQIRSLSNGMVDGLIIATTLQQFQDIEKAIPENFPVVMIDRGIENCKADQVLISSENAMIQGVRDLAADAESKNEVAFIGYVGGLTQTFTTAQRVKEFQTALQEADLEFHEERVRYISPGTPIEELAEELLAQGCNSIVAGNNIITMDLVNIALKKSAADGKPFNILGYSYGDWYSWLPFLKTITVPTRDAGQLAVRRLLERIESGSDTPKEYIITSLYNV